MTIRTRATLGALFAVSLLFAAGGCGRGVSTAEAVRFNDTLVGLNARLAQAGKEFGEAAVKAVDGDLIEIAKAKRAFEKLTETMDGVKSESKGLKVPDSASARRLHEEFRRMLQAQEQMVKDDLGDVLRLLEDPQQTSAERRKKIAPIGSYLEAIDTKVLAGVRKAQAAFAGEYGFKLK